MRRSAGANRLAAQALLGDDLVCELVGMLASTIITADDLVTRHGEPSLAFTLWLAGEWKIRGGRPLDPQIVATAVVLALRSKERLGT